MSVQFGRWQFDGAPAAPEYLEKVRKLMEPFGPDGSRWYSAGGVSVLHGALQITKESLCETQPEVTRSGTVLTWDGRLDNRAEFIAGMGPRLGTDSPDVSVVAAAYERWGTRCFARLLGDWALAIWDPQDRSLILAKDPIGTRPLFYVRDDRALAWSSLLDPLLLCAEKTFALDEEYIAGYFSLFPATHLTPYAGIASVAPACYVRLEPEKETIHKYWDFDPDKRIRYGTDAEYEDHFRTVFRESVRRRLRSARPVLAELSGGMDSSSIVCVADTVIAQANSEAPRLDTLSYFNDFEPNWNERPYVTKVEERRGRAGFHIDLGEGPTSLFAGVAVAFHAIPGSLPKDSQSARQRAACLREGGYRVVLSGIGGDEVTGGVPTPVPELADLVARARVRRLGHQLKMWALAKRKPWFHLFFETALRFLPRSMGRCAKHRPPPLWLDPAFIERQRLALYGYEARLQLSRALPSFQEAVSTIDALRRQLGSDHLCFDPPYEKRYPYLDRDFLEFLCAVPREQLVRPGERRSLMRRALVGIVPDQVLHRRRKAYMARTPLAAIAQEWEHVSDLATNMVAASLGIVNAQSFANVLHKAREGKEVPIVSLMRTLDMEIWLRAREQPMSLDYRTMKSPLNLSVAALREALSLSRSRLS